MNSAASDFVFLAYGLLYALHEAIQNPSCARSKYHTQLAKMDFDEILALIAVFFFFFLICTRYILGTTRALGYDNVVKSYT